VKDGKKCVKNVLLNLKGKLKMEDEFIITFLNNKKYKIKDVKKIVKSKPKEYNKYVSTIDEKICKWKIK
jgi:ribose 5-phosphate isomerase RpiB